MANYLTNRSPIQALECMTPYEAWNGSRPDLSYLQRFKYDAYMYLPPAKRTKLEAKTRCGIMLGYVHNTMKLWRI
jgi:hypothetical protein